MNNDLQQHKARRKLPTWMTNSSGDKDLPELLVFRGELKYYTTEESCCKVSRKLLEDVERADDISVLGFDMEWPYDFRTGSAKTALIQICPSETVSYLFHVYNLKSLPEPLYELIKHQKVKLVGLNIANDLWKLGRDFEISVKKIIENNIIDIANLGNNILKTSQIFSLERLVLQVLKKRIGKPSAIRRGDWGIENLSTEQLSYAATDAYASLLCYKKLLELHL